MSPNSTIHRNTQSLIRKLKEFKERRGSWDDVSDCLSIHKRTILRWIKKGTISEPYRRLVDGLLYYVPQKLSPQQRTRAVINRLLAYKEQTGSWAQASRNLSVPVQTLQEWSYSKKLSRATIQRLNGLLDKVTGATTTTSRVLIEKLLRYKDKKGGWTGVSNILGIPKRSMQRWVETGKIDKVYIRLLERHSKNW